MQSINVTADKLSLNVQIAGVHGAPVLLFLHGFLDRQQTWKHQLAQLKAHYQVVTFDMRGVALSYSPGLQFSYQIDNLVADVSAIIDAVVGKNSRRVHLVAHDWGAVVAWSLLSEPYYARRIASCTAFGGMHLGVMWDWARHNISSLQAQKIIQVLGQAASSWHAAFINLPFLPEMLIKRGGLCLWRRLLAKNGVAIGDDYLQNTTQAQLEQMLLKPLELYRQNVFSPPEVPLKRNIEVPILQLVATNDCFIKPYVYAHLEHFASALKLQPIAAKHWLHHSHSLEFNMLVDDFVRQVERQ